MSSSPKAWQVHVQLTRAAQDTMWLCNTWSSPLRHNSHLGSLGSCFDLCTLYDSHHTSHSSLARGSNGRHSNDQGSDHTLSFGIVHSRSGRSNHRTSDSPSPLNCPRTHYHIACHGPCSCLGSSLYSCFHYHGRNLCSPCLHHGHTCHYWGEGGKGKGEVGRKEGE